MYWFFPVLLFQFLQYFYFFCSFKVSRSHSMSLFTLAPSQFQYFTIVQVSLSKNTISFLLFIILFIDMYTNTQRLNQSPQSWYRKNLFLLELQFLTFNYSYSATHLCQYAWISKHDRRKRTRTLFAAAAASGMCHSGIDTDRKGSLHEFYVFEVI